MLVLLALAGAGAALFGAPGALGGYVLGMLVFAILPQTSGGSCAVPPPPASLDGQESEEAEDGKAEDAERPVREREPV